MCIRDRYDIERMIKISEFRRGYEYAIADWYGLIGEDEKALEWLEKYVETKKFPLPDLSFNIHFKNLHDNPRFIAILEKMGLAKFY